MPINRPKRDGVPTIITLSRKICKVARTYGAGSLTASTSPEFAAAVAALMLACDTFSALDDYPGQVDNTGSDGPEDAGFPPT